jgi:hypothetical protein
LAAVVEGEQTLEISHVNKNVQQCRVQYSVKSNLRSINSIWLSPCSRDERMIIVVGKQSSRDAPVLSFPRDTCFLLVKWLIPPVERRMGVLAQLTLSDFEVFETLFNTLLPRVLLFNLNLELSQRHSGPVIISFLSNIRLQPPRVLVYQNHINNLHKRIPSFHDSNNSNCQLPLPSSHSTLDIRTRTLSS